jgi:alkylation response protein AidB-like acyl-CoA dehydrogenase
MYQAGLFAMLAPKAHGGRELHPVEAMRVWEAIARIDSAAAWNLVMNQAISAYAAWLPAEGVRELFRHGCRAQKLHPYPPGPPRRKPSSIRRLWPLNPFAENSRLYSPPWHA